jgi:pimeloyl-ACP methyl ester carboxylesterase
MLTRITVLAAALFASTAGDTQSLPAQASAQADVLVTVAGRRMNIRCVGDQGPGPAVLLEAGGGAASSAWARVQEALPSNVRSCAYDRAGLGKSEPGPGPRTMSQEVHELHALLGEARVRGPYVLVGHSIGGLLVRLFTDRYPDDVAAVVLVEPTHESAVLGVPRFGGMVRLREKAGDRPVPEPKLEGPPSTAYRVEDDYLAEELQQLYLARRARPQPLAMRPLIVLAGAKRPNPPPGISAEQWNALRDERDEQVRDLAALSGNSRYVRDDTSGHNLPQENPALVVRAIVAAVAAVRDGKPLADDLSR